MFNLNNIKIKKASKNEYKEIEKIGEKSLPIYYSVEDLSLLSMTNHDIFIISSEEILGFVVCKETENNIHILSIAVNPELRNKSIGSQMINFLKSKKKNLSLYVHTINDRGIKFYKKNNFVISNILFGYYENFKIDKDAYKMIFNAKEKNHESL